MSEVLIWAHILKCNIGLLYFYIYSKCTGLITKQRMEISILSSQTSVFNVRKLHRNVQDHRIDACLGGAWSL